VSPVIKGVIEVKLGVKINDADEGKVGGWMILLTSGDRDQVWPDS